MDRSQLDAALLSFVAAFVDTCGFVGLYGLFTAHVTGNFVLMGAELIHHQGELLGKLLSFPVFILAVAATTLAAHALRRRGKDRLAPALWLQCALLLVAMALPAWVGTPTGAGQTSALWIGVVLVAAMGIQNALMRLELASLPPTTVMTGNVTQVTIDLMTRWRDDAIADGQPDERKAAGARLRKMWLPLLTFLLGAAGGAAGYGVVGFWCLAVPAVVCGWLACRLRSAPA
ncbi:YoaK family protein [Variovorax sp. PAMC 28711]|uniref:YoaK family protein n=1 Tax=Variovorax sp. PAMC 28711 TaxID=1795631 RepID=UPI000B0E5B24|nr:YoaK family protein [Variovorax sp. PAMC 28711]